MRANLIRLCSSLKQASSVLAFQTVGVFSTYAPRHFDAAFRTLKYYVSNLYLPRFNFTSLYQCTALIIPILTTLLQLKYQGTDQRSSPFETHPTTMSVAVSSSTVNYLAFIAHLRFPRGRFAAASYLCLVCSSYASVASLTSLLFADSARPYIYFIFALVSAAEVLRCSKRLVMDEGVGLRACKRRMNRFLNKIRMFAAHHDGRHRSHILPV